MIKNFKEWIKIREEKDACYYKVKKTASVWPSAYASGRLVQCRKKGAENYGKNKKNEQYLTCHFCDSPVKLIEMWNEKIPICSNCDIIESETFSKEKSKGLHGWFERRGGEGSKGWVDCNTCKKDPDTGRKKCKSCGRKEGEHRSKYPACRPTPSACNKKGTRRKKSSKRISWN
jgi:hypothetical protein